MGKARPFNDGPSPQQRGIGSVEEWEEIGEVFETVVREVDQEGVDLAAVFRR